MAFGRTFLWLAFLFCFLYLYTGFIVLGIACGCMFRLCSTLYLVFLWLQALSDESRRRLLGGH